MAKARQRVQVRIRDELLSRVDAEVLRRKARGEKVSRTAMFELGLELALSEEGVSPTTALGPSAAKPADRAEAFRQATTTRR